MRTVFGKLLLSFQLFESFDGAWEFWVDHQGLFVTLDRELFLASSDISLAKTVINVGRFGIFLDDQLKDVDGVSDLLLAKKLIAKAVEIGLAMRYVLKTAQFHFAITRA